VGDNWRAGRAGVYNTSPRTRSPMEDVLWYLLASSRGGATRARVLRLLDERPRNANELAEAMDVHYTTVRHHLDVLEENNVVRSAGEGYGAPYLLTDHVETHREELETVLDTVDSEKP
jgi:DNA-binding transcriptional ArsR family regulator